MVYYPGKSFSLRGGSARGDMKRFFLAIALVFLCGAVSFSFVSKFLKTDPNSLEYRLLTRPDSVPLRVGSLLASGVPEEFLSGYLVQISNFINEVRPATAGKNPEEKAYILFSEMHKKILKKYEESSTTLDVLLKTGKYNCLSSTVFYSILLEEFGIPFKVAVLPTHTFTVIRPDEQPGAQSSAPREIDVENTTPFGFHIGTNRQAQENFRKLTGFVYSADSGVRELADRAGLIAYTYGNVAYFATKMNQTESAFQNVLKSVAVFSGGRYVYTNVVAGYSQYIYHLTDRDNNYELALAISEEALLNLPRREMFLSNYYYTLDKYLDALVNDAKFQEAFGVYSKGRQVAGPNRVIEDNLYGRILYRLVVKDQDLDKAYPYARQAVTDLPGSQNVRNMLVNGLNILQRRLAKSWDSYPQGEEFFLKWYALMKDSNFDILLENYYVEVSGRFYEAADYDRAIAVNRRGLDILPGSAVLRKNLVILSGNAAGVFFKKNDNDNGLKYSKIALQYDPKNDTVLNNIRVVYRMRAYAVIEKGDFRTGLAIAEEGLGYVPDDAKLKYYQDYCRRKLRDGK